MSDHTVHHGTREQAIRILTSRAARGVLIPEEGDLLRVHVETVLADLEKAEAALDATYRERAHLVALLAALHPSHIGHTDPTAPDWAVVIVEAPGGQLSWHIAPRDMDLFTHVQPTNRICRGWDGHTADEKYERIRELTASTEQLPL